VKRFDDLAIGVVRKGDVLADVLEDSIVKETDATVTGSSDTLQQS
jgi:hypothetical protein